MTFSKIFFFKTKEKYPKNGSSQSTPPKKKIQF